MTGFVTWSVVILIVAVLGELVLILSLARMVGTLMARVGRPGNIRYGPAGPLVGTEVPAVETFDVYGNPVMLGPKSRVDTLVLFMSPKCPSCLGLIPALKSLRLEWRDLAVIAVGPDPDTDNSHITYADKLKKLSVPYVASSRIYDHYQIQSTPFGVVIDDKGVLLAKGTVNHKDHLDAILEVLGIGYQIIDPSPAKIVDGAVQ